MNDFTERMAKDLGYIKAHWAWLSFGVGVVIGVVAMLFLKVM